MSNEKENQFKVHNIVGIDPSISLTKVGQLSAEQLSCVSKAFTRCSPIGWEADSTPIDKELASRFNFDLDACIADDDFVLFGFTSGNKKKSQLKTLFSVYPETAHNNFGVLDCDSYFAHIHDDKEVVKSAGQIMFVVDNIAGHTLYSKDNNGVEHTLIPEKGDIVLLDVWCQHSVIPNQSKGIDFMKANGMKLVCFAIE